MWRLLSASVVLLLFSNLVNGQTNTTSTGGFLADEIPLEISTAIPSRLLSADSFFIFGQQALTVVFSRPVIALGSDFGLEELPPELVPFTVTPSIPGRDRWVTTFIYRFDSDGRFATDLDIVFRWNLGLRTYDGVPLTLDSPESVILQTSSLTMRISDVSSVQAEEATDNNWSAFVGTNRDILPEVPPDGIIRLRFNAPVSLAALQANLKLRDVTRGRVSATRPIVARCRSTRLAQNDESTCAAVTLTQELEMGIRYALFIEAGVDYGTASGPLRRGVSDDFGDLRDFYIPFREFSFVSITTPFLNLYLPHGLAEGTSLADIPISITDDSSGQRITFNLTQLTKSVYLIEAPLMPLENYTIAVKASDPIRDGFGLPLNGSGANLRGRSVFAEFRGMEPQGFPAYGVFEANEDWGRLAATFAKGLGENDNGLCEEGSVLSIWSISQPETGIWLFSGSSRTSYDQLIGPPTASLVSPRVDPIATLATYDLGPLLKNAGGVGTQYCRFDRFFPAVFVETFFQAVVISNSASAENDAALTVWVTSMVTGLPVEGANVFLLQYFSFNPRNPELIAEGTTNLDGIAKIPRRRTRGSLMVVVRVGSKFLYIPGVSFRSSVSRTYDDSIIIDRALVRPGETLFVKGYVMQREGNEYIPATGFTRPRLILSPPISGNSSFPIELNKEFGSFEGQIEVPEDADLARYRVWFVANIGNTTRTYSGDNVFFTVGDPSLPIIELVPDTPFFVRPNEDIEFSVQISEEIVRREVSLTPSVPRFARVGDVFEAGAVVTASGSTIVPISLTAEIEGPLAFVESSSLVVEVGGDGQEEARFLVRATKIGTVNFTLVADDGQGNTDALQVEIPIEGLQEAVTVGSSFVVQGDESGAFTEGLDLPAAVPGSGDIAITAGVGRQPAVLAVSRQLLVRNPLLLCPLSADFIVALAVIPGVVNPYNPWNPDPEVISPALVEQINSIVPRFEDAVEQLAVGGNFTSSRLGLRSSVPCPEYFFTPRNPSLRQNNRVVFMVNLVEQNLINHELEEVQSTAEALFEARDVWRGVLAAQLEELAIDQRRRSGRPISLSTVAQALAALGPEWTPQTTNETIIDDLSLDRLSRNFDSLGTESQAYYILTRLTQVNGSAHSDIPRAVETWTNLFRVTGRTAYISAFTGATYPASDLTNALVFLAFTRAGEEGQWIPRLGSYIAAPASDNYGFTFYGSYAQVITMQALVEFDVSRGSAQPNLAFAARSGNTTILEASFTNSTPPVASATILWEDLPPRPAPIEVSAVGEGEAFVAVTLNFIPAEILPFPSYRGIYVQRSIQLEDGEQGDGPGLAVVPRGTVVTIKVQFLTPDSLDETIVRVLMPAGLEPLDPNISPSSSSRFCPIPFYRSFSFFYGTCPVQETRPSVITITYNRVNPGTSSVTFRAVAATVGTYTLPPTRVFVSDQPEVMGLSSGGQFEVCAGPSCQPEFLEPSPPPVDCVDDCNNSGTCNLSNGSCLCFTGFTGSACESTV